MILLLVKYIFIGLNILVVTLDLCIFIMTCLPYLGKYSILVLEVYHKHLNFELSKGLSCQYCFALSLDKPLKGHDTVTVESVCYAIYFYVFWREIVLCGSGTRLYTSLFVSHCEQRCGCGHPNKAGPLLTPSCVLWVSVPSGLGGFLQRCLSCGRILTSFLK